MAELMKEIIHSACQVVGYSKDAAGGCNSSSVQGTSVLSATEFKMPVHYPSYSKREYEEMEEWRLDLLFSQYGLRFEGSLAEKRAYAIGAFLWPDQI
ncbi:hypothetical protein LINPERPRIM_LOCUS2429 [Linum perenne]